MEEYKCRQEDGLKRLKEKVDPFLNDTDIQDLMKRIEAVLFWYTICDFDWEILLTEVDIAIAKGTEALKGVLTEIKNICELYAE